MRILSTCILPAPPAPAPEALSEPGGAFAGEPLAGAARAPLPGEAPGRQPEPAALRAGADDAGRRLDRVLRKALPGMPLSLLHKLLRRGKVLVDGRAAGPRDRVPEGAEIQILARLGPGCPAGAAALPAAPQPAAPRQAADRQAAKGPGGKAWLPGAAPSAADRQPAARRDARRAAAHGAGERAESRRLPALPEPLARGSGIAVFSKPAGMASHGPGSLDELVKAAFAQRPRGSLSFMPGPLHRLDRPTSGAIAFSESLSGARLFAELMRGRRIEKTYLAIVEGLAPDGELEWRDCLLRDGAARKTLVAQGGCGFPREGGAGEAGGNGAAFGAAAGAGFGAACGAAGGAAPLAGGAGRPGMGPAKAALTRARALARGGGRTLLEAKIVTGRTHQIRAQAAARGLPLAGDAKYGGAKHGGAKHGGAPGEPGGFFLHAWKIGFGAGAEGLPRIVAAPPPQRFVREMLRLFGRNPLEGLPD